MTHPIAPLEVSIVPFDIQNALRVLRALDPSVDLAQAHPRLETLVMANTAGASDCSTMFSGAAEKVNVAVRGLGAAEGVFSVLFSSDLRRRVALQALNHDPGLTCRVRFRGEGAFQRTSKVMARSMA